MRQVDRYYARKDVKASRPGKPRFVVVDRISKRPVSGNAGVNFTSLEQAERAAQQYNSRMRRRKNPANAILARTDNMQVREWAIAHPAVIKDLRDASKYAEKIGAPLTLKDIREVLDANWIDSLPFPEEEFLAFSAQKT